MESYLAVSLLLIGIGVVLLIGEFFVPSGIMVVAGITLFAVAVAVIFYHDRTEGIIATVGLCVALPAAFAGLFKAWQQFSLKSGLDADQAGGTLTAAMPELSELERLKGKYGRTVTPMRPSGAVEIDGRRVDALTEGVMLDAGVWVRCVDVRGSRVTVRQVDAPANLSDINLDDMK